MYIYTHIHRAENRRIRIAKCKSFWGNLANHFGEVIRQIFWALQITFGQL